MKNLKENIADFPISYERKKSVLKFWANPVQLFSAVRIMELHKFFDWLVSTADTENLLN